MMRPGTILGLACLAFAAIACRKEILTKAEHDDLTRHAAAAVADIAKLDLAGLAMDTVRWQLRLVLRDFSPADSAHVSAEITRAYSRILIERSDREIFIESNPFSIRADTADVEARIGARSMCAGSPRNSFAAYRLRFVSAGGTWNLAERTSLGHTDSAPCIPELD
jgi:hypothetical protein